MNVWWIAVSLLYQSASRAATAGMMITAATTWVSSSTNLVAMVASAMTGGTNESAVRITVVTTNV